MTAPDITKRLTENAHVLEAHKYTTAAATMRDAADEIVALRILLDNARQIACTHGWDVT